ncbi:XRE family transcriptional regulator [Erwiniaceae bacterium BAC15a-03b]|uniref:XRE family transcriptional regulator n=1 Tax=Winslowiella arboricola TaxID=2978220 RepID=A0A9J6Q038_9GAMM|nr:XRE family transcriptional regulator [Winslowiella arboricola]MCU5775535.1 XRE family transcriptional regulator [Winslowiella arboricola]MCU5779615.1 XRE family transcriptional regulator [Winslowiella arboricola]
MQQLNQQLALTLKQLRAERQWSLTEAAARTGVSKAMLGQIERAESSPTVATLWKIATGFNVAFSAFIEPVLTPAPVTVQRYRDLAAFSQASVGMRVVPLFPFDHQLGFDMFVVDLAPGAVSASSPHQPGVIEHVIVIEGQLELMVNDSWHQLAAGDALRFQADCAHTYRNATTENVRLHDLIHYPLAR